jgi:hypothetical protein
MAVAPGREGAPWREGRVTGGASGEGPAEPRPSPPIGRRTGERAVRSGEPGPTSRRGPRMNGARRDGIR